jgi:hypothetical protein
VTSSPTDENATTAPNGGDEPEPEPTNGPDENGKVFADPGEQIPHVGGVPSQLGVDVETDAQLPETVHPDPGTAVPDETAPPPEPEAPAEQ